MRRTVSVNGDMTLDPNTEIKTIIKKIGDNIPIIGLNATATPKVQEDILKNLAITEAKTFKASFNRPNLYYEIVPNPTS